MNDILHKCIRITTDANKQEEEKGKKAETYRGMCVDPVRSPLIRGIHGDHVCECLSGWNAAVWRVKEEE